VSLTIYTDKKSYRIGENVRILVTFANAGPGSVTYASPTPCDPNMRITVTGSNKTQDLSYSETPVQACIQVLQPRSVEPNATRIQSATWTLTFDVNGSSTQAKPGAYTITARFPLASFETNFIEAHLGITVA
jgi:hypothetical protein